MNVCLCTIPAMGGSCEGCTNNRHPLIPDNNYGDFKPVVEFIREDGIEEFRRLVRKLRAEGKL